jgi:hypothetical protein
MLLWYSKRGCWGNYARAHVRVCSKNYNFSIHKYYSGNILYYFYYIYSNYFLLVILNIKVVKESLWYGIKYISLQTKPCGGLVFCHPFCF